MEVLARQKRFAAVLDLCLQELGNQAHGSVVTSGPDRLQAAGLHGVPQIVAPGGIDMLDLQAWKELPGCYVDRPYHAHNRLIASVLMNPAERRVAAQLVASKLALARGPTAFIAPLGGVEQWDRAGEPLHDPEGLAAFFDELRQCIPTPLHYVEVDAHINDAPFVQTVLAVFDTWVAQGHIAPGVRSALPLQEAA